MSDRKLLQQFVDSFGRFDDMIATENAPVEMLVKQDGENWDSWDKELKWHPVYLETDPHVLTSVYTDITGRFPQMYECLILSYRWLEVDLGLVRLLANPPGTDLTGLNDAIFNDRILCDVLIPAGFVPFARSRCNYDPICFSLNAMTSQDDCPIVQFEHEPILCDSKIGKHWQRWDSFRDLMTEVVYLDFD